MKKVVVSRLQIIFFRPSSDVWINTLTIFCEEDWDELEAKAAKKDKQDREVEKETTKAPAKKSKNR